MHETVLAVDRDLVTVLRDLGLPTLIGALVGALVTHFAARARGREEHERSRDLLVVQDERRSAQSALDAVRDIRNRINEGTGGAYGALHNEWQDRVSSSSRLIREEEIDSRVRALGYVIFLSTLARDEDVTYTIVRAASDVEEALEAWLRREPFPPRHVPPMDEIRPLVMGRNRVDFVPFNQYLAERTRA